MVCILYLTNELHDFERVPSFRDKIIIIYFILGLSCACIISVNKDT